MVANKQDWWRGKKAALVVAHPGHELLVHHWMETAKPLVLVLTDGSVRAISAPTGSTARPRSWPARARVQRRRSSAGWRTGISTGPFWPAKRRHSGRLLRKWPQFSPARRSTMSPPTRSRGSILGIDICRLLVNAALARLRERNGRDLPNLEFPLEAVSLKRETARQGGIELHLDAGA